MSFFFAANSATGEREECNLLFVKVAHETSGLCHYSSMGTNKNGHYLLNGRGHALLICVVAYNNFVMLRCSPLCPFYHSPFGRQ